MGTISIVGRPNVGKSALFNRIAKARIAIVFDQPGVTRDRVAREVEAAGRRFLLVDTGGLAFDRTPGSEDPLAAETCQQAAVAVADSDACLIVVDVRAGVTPLDEEVIRRVRASGVPCGIVANKCDRSEDAALADDICFELWDDKKLEKKIAEYVSKDYPVEKIIEQVLRPWKQAITKYFHDITEQEINNSTEKFHAFDLKHSHDHSAQYIKNVLQPFFNKHGLAGIKMWIPDKGSSPLFMENQGYLAKYNAWDVAFYPNAHYSMCAIYGELNNTPLRALAYYLQKMPEITIKTDEVVIKVMHLYDGLMLQKNKNYRENVEFLDSLAAQHKGTPVGKMMKFLRWNAGRFINPKPKGNLYFSISTIKVVGETSFSFVRKDVLQSYSMVNGQLTVTYKDEVIERWLDADCQNVYVADPVTTDYDEWVKNHRKGMFADTWSWSVQNFLSDYSPRDSKPSLSIDFIEQKL